MAFIGELVALRGGIAERLRERADQEAARARCMSSDSPAALAARYAAEVLREEADGIENASTV